METCSCGDSVLRRIKYATVMLVQFLLRDANIKGFGFELESIANRLVVDRLLSFTKTCLRNLIYQAL